MHMPVSPSRLAAALVFSCMMTACGSQPRQAATSSAPANASSSGQAASPSGPASASSSSSAVAAGNPAPLSPAVHVKIGRIGLLGEAGLAIAQSRGYFRDEGLDVEFVPFKSGAEQTPLLSSGQIDFGSTSPDPGTFNAIGRGIPIKVVAPEATTLAGDKHAEFVIRKDLIDSGKYKEPKDLKGMNIGAGPVLGTTGQYLVEQVLKRGGLSVSDVNLVPLAYADVITAMANKKIDASWDVEPNIANAERAGLIVRSFSVDELSPGALGEGLLLSPNFAQAQPEAARRVITAQLRGQRDYYNAIEKNDGHKADIVAILVKDGLVKDAATFDSLGQTTVDPNDEVNASVLGDYEDYFIRSGQLKDKVPINQVVDPSYAQYAVQRLGRL